MTGYIVVASRANPLLREMQTHAAGMQTHNATNTGTHTHVHIIILTHNATKTLHRQTRTYIRTVVTPALQSVAQSDPLGTMVLFEWGQTMELFGI